MYCDKIDGLRAEYDKSVVVAKSTPRPRFYATKSPLNDGP